MGGSVPTNYFPKCYVFFIHKYQYWSILCRRSFRKSIPSKNKLYVEVISVFIVLSHSNSRLPTIWMNIWLIISNDLKLPRLFCSLSQLIISLIQRKHIIMNKKNTYINWKIFLTNISNIIKRNSRTANTTTNKYFLSK